MICLYEEEGEQYIVLEKRANGIRQGGRNFYRAGNEIFEMLTLK